jgi:asparagine synthetase B (glutamine-hydrolysing)
MDRGPDWSGLHQHGDDYLAHQRLAIVDSASGDQPLFSEDKSIIVLGSSELLMYDLSFATEVVFSPIYYQSKRYLLA